MRIEPADDATFRELEQWRYEPPYDFYNGDEDPVWKDVEFVEMEERR